MKKPEEITRLGNQWALDNADRTMETNSALNKGYVGGYTECQKYMADEIRRWRVAVEAQERRCKSLRDIIESNADKKYTQEDMVKDIVKAVERTYRYVDNEGWSLDYIKKEIIQSLNKKD